MLVVVDLGNSAVKFGAFEADRLVATERVESGRGVGESVGGSVIPFPFFTTAEEVVIASSAPGELPAFVANAQRRVRVLGEDVQRSVETPYDDPTELGIDRIAAVYGARVLAGAPVVAVDVGTAVTVDALDAHGRMLPVAIGPGLAAAADGLRARAPHLPRADTNGGPVRVPAEGTADSLRTGFVVGLAGLLDRLVAEAAAAVGGEPPTVLTGGRADVVAPHLRCGARHEPHAVLHGIRALHLEFPP